MRRISLFLTAFFCAGVFAISQAVAGGVVSTMANVDAVSEAGGFYLVPVHGYSAVRVAGEEAPAQVFEVIRPRGEGFSIGRLHTSCTCVQVETPKSAYANGERAFLVLRNFRATPPNGQNYAIYAQIVSPIRTTLRVDTFVQSDRYRAGNSLRVAHAPSYQSDAYGPAPQAYRQPTPAAPVMSVRPLSQPNAPHANYRF